MTNKKDVFFIDCRIQGVVDIFCIKPFVDCPTQFLNHNVLIIHELEKHCNNFLKNNRGMGIYAGQLNISDIFQVIAIIFYLISKIFLHKIIFVEFPLSSLAARGARGAGTLRRPYGLAVGDRTPLCARINWLPRAYFFSINAINKGVSQ